MTKKTKEQILLGAHCCVLGICEPCPYAPAAEGCEDELMADMLWTLEEEYQQVDQAKENSALVTMEAERKVNA